jgi:flagellar biosynthesis/type III secretory pathway protein FliH
MARPLQVLLGKRLPTHGIVAAAVRADGLDAVAEEVRRREIAASHARGREQGRRETLEGAAKLLAAAAEQLEAARAQAEQDLPREVLELAVEISDQLLRSRLADGAYDLERIVRSALAGGGVDRGRCIVHVHPRDMAALQGVAFREDTVLVAHPELTPGTVHVETPRGLLVRDPSEALEQVREALLEGLV